jgi:glycolate oxidase
LVRDKIIERVFEELSSILGRRVSRDPVDLGLHAIDASSYYFIPKDLSERYVLAVPKDAEEVSEVIKIAGKHGVSVIPQGSSTDLSMGSGSISVTTANQIYMLERGIILHTGMMSSIEEISETDRVAVVEPGVRIDSLNEALAETDLFFPVDPASARAASVGGAIATGAGGLRGAKYGTMRDWVLGLEFVDGLGRIHRTGCRTVKCRQGYDITRLMVGSEGTLGVITKAVLKLWPRPAAISRLMAVFNDFTSLYRFFLGVRRGRVPLIAEYMENRVADKVIRTLGLGIPVGHTLILDLEAGSEEEAEKLLKTLEKDAKDAGAFYTATATDRDRSFEEIYRFRRSMYAGMVKMKLKRHIIFEDTAVPISKLPEFVRRVREIEGKYGREIALGGHLGDGNLHPHIECDLEDPDDRSLAFKIAKEIVIEALKLGGTSSSEHGIGSMKLELLLIELRNKGSEHTLDLMINIKKAFDPKWILNPGRVIPTEPGRKI